MPLVDETYEVSPLKILRYVLKHMVPLFWGVSILPFYMSWVFATSELFPSYFIDIFTSGSSTQAEVNRFWEFLLGVIVMGPFLGGSTLLYNDYWDSEVDKNSKRKSLFPLPSGLVSHRAILIASIFLMILAIVMSFFISLLFMVLVSIAVALSICYSTPPLRLKNRAGLDVMTNAIGSGVICSIAGWIVTQPLIDYPVLWGFTSLFGVSSIYIPTTIIDSESDKLAGVNTFSVRFGKKNAFLVGLSCVIIANILIIFMGLTNYLIDVGFLYVAWPIALAQPVLYAIILRKQSFKNVYRTIMALSGLLTVGNAMMMTYYVGLWSI